MGYIYNPLLRYNLQKTTAETTPTATTNLLLENGDYLLLENGDKLILG